LFTDAQPGTPPRAFPLLLIVLLWLSQLVPSAPAQQSQSQQTPSEQTTTQPSAGASPQAGSGNSSSPQNPPAAQTALNNPRLVETDEKRSLTCMEPRIEFEYRYDRFDGGINGDTAQITWLQSFGSAQRLAAGIEFPVSYQSAEGPGEHSATGVGDITLQFRGMLSKGEKFEQAAGIEVTVPSSSPPLADGQTVLKSVWGFSAALARETLLNGEFGYNRAVENQYPVPDTNSFEPEIILTQGLTKRVDGYLDWDTYYEFNLHEYVMTLQPGLDIALDRQGKWTLSPFAIFPLNHASRAVETGFAAGFDFAYNF